MTKESQSIVPSKKEREVLFSTANGSPNEEAFILDIMMDRNNNFDHYAAEETRLQNIKDKTRDTNAKASSLTATGFFFSTFNGVLRIAASLKKAPTIPSPAAPDTLLHHAETAMLIGRGCYDESSRRRSELRFDTTYVDNRQNPISKALTYNSNFFSLVSAAHAIPVTAMIAATLLHRTSAGRKLAQTYAPRFSTWMDELLASKADNPSKAFAWANYFKGPGFNITGATGLAAAASLKTGDHFESNHRMNNAYDVVAKQEGISKEVASKYVNAALPHQTLRETAVFNMAYLGICMPAALGGAASSLFQFSKAYPWLGKKFSEATLKKAGDIGGMVNGTGYSLWPLVPATIPPDVTYTIEKNSNLSERHLAEHLNQAWKSINQSAGPELGAVAAVIGASAFFRFKYPSHALSSMFLGKADVIAGGLIIGGGAVIRATAKDGIGHVTSNWLRDNPLLRTAFYVRSFSAGSRLAMIDSTIEYLEKTGKETSPEEKDAFLRTLASRTAVAKGLLTEDELKNMPTLDLEHYLGTACYTRKDDKRTEKEKNEDQRKNREIADASLPESRPICPEAYYAREIRDHIGRDRESGLFQKEGESTKPTLPGNSILTRSFVRSYPNLTKSFVRTSYPAAPPKVKVSSAQIAPLVEREKAKKTSWTATIVSQNLGASLRHL